MTEHPTSRRSFLALAGAGTVGVALYGLRPRPAVAETFPYHLTDAQWRRKLPPAAYDVLRQEGTERPFSSPLLNVHQTGIFACKGCGQHLYSSKTKYDSGTGWPSFWAPLPHAIGTRTDTSLGMTRTEVHCARCGGHQGHVFDDGPQPTGKRYCMNGVSMTFTPGAA